MTVTYSLSVNSVDFAGFSKLLLRWKGGIYRLVWRELLLFSAFYYIIMAIYRFALKGEHQRRFERIALYCREILNLIPITFAMGFYVNLVVTRWWDQYMNLPWVDKCCVLIGTYVRGNTLEARKIKRNLARYLNLMGVLTLAEVSAVVKKRFPDRESIQAAGILTEEEKRLLEQTPHDHGVYYFPALWFGNLVMKAREQGLIRNDNHLSSLITELNNYRSNCGMLLSYDWVSIPLVYTQVVSIAVYFFFLASLFGRQYLFRDESDDGLMVPKYFPVFMYLQFLFYMGWLKCAEQLINPLGDDDEDFEVNYLIDRNIVVGLTMVDNLTAQEPTLVDDFDDDDLPPDGGGQKEQQETASPTFAHRPSLPRVDANTTPTPNGYLPRLPSRKVVPTLDAKSPMKQGLLQRRATVPWATAWRQRSTRSDRSTTSEFKMPRPFTVIL